MAVLTPAQLAEVRQNIAAGGTAINYTKAQLDAATQAVEDWFETSRPSLSTAINAATTPLVLTGAQKRALLIRFLAQKASRE